MGIVPVVPPPLGSRRRRFESEIERLRPKLRRRRSWFGWRRRAAYAACQRLIALREKLCYQPDEWLDAAPTVKLPESWSTAIPAVPARATIREIGKAAYAAGALGVDRSEVVGVTGATGATGASYVSVPRGATSVRGRLGPTGIVIPGKPPENPSNLTGW